jgi:hypothetical protein
MGLLYFIYIDSLNFVILTLGFDNDGCIWNLSRMEAFVFHNKSCSLLGYCLLLFNQAEKFKFAGNGNNAFGSVVAELVGCGS